MTFLYNFGVNSYAFALRIASVFNPKAKDWVTGRKNQKSYISTFKNDKPLVWFHCASLGEFEMAKPLIEKLRKDKGDDIFILLTFFSPSGYKIKKNYNKVDKVLYLPIDTPKNAHRFTNVFKPKIVVFVKNEIWLNFIYAIQKVKGKMYLMNAVFNKNQRFFKTYGKSFRKGLKMFDKIYLQDNESHQLLLNIGIQGDVVGDTRVDRVLQTYNNCEIDNEILEWKGVAHCLVCGSTWPDEEKIISSAKNLLPEWKIIIAPHDISVAHIQSVLKLFPNAVLHSEFELQKNRNTQVLIIDSIGLLSKLYSTGTVAIVGGGFSGKLHNILEPAVFLIPVLIGPKHQRFFEAQRMIDYEGAFEFNSSQSLVDQINFCMKSLESSSRIKNAHKIFFDKNNGATDKTFQGIFGAF